MANYSSDSSRHLKVLRATPIQIRSTASDMQGKGESDASTRKELARRPSYRKLLDDLTDDLNSYMHEKNRNNSNDNHLTQDSNDDNNNDDDDDDDDDDDVVAADGHSYRFASRNSKPESGIQSLRVRSSKSATVVQYTQGPDGGQYFIPVDQLGSSDVMSLRPGIMVGRDEVGFNSIEQVMEDAARKREVRLLKNKEAAKECRRKKKEYVRCLENRVAVLENQNRTLIDELKSLKELYCQKEEEVRS